MRRLAGVMLLLLLYALPGRADEAPAPCFDSLTGFDAWLTDYYESPEPEKLSCSLAFYADSAMYDRPDSRMPVAQFHAALLRDDPAALTALYDSLGAAGSENAKLMGLHVFWVADNEQGRKLLERAATEWNTPEIERILARMAQESPVPMLDGAVSNPFVVDALWSIFYATGDERAVRKVAGAISLTERSKGLDAATEKAARYSLLLNGRRSAHVRELVARIAAEDPGAAGEPLRQVVRELEATATAEAGN